MRKEKNSQLADSCLIQLKKKFFFLKTAVVFLSEAIDTQQIKTYGFGKERDKGGNTNGNGRIC
ncbi:MAG: hypothetical protein LKJ12_03035 [Enterococcaceae bacterium]|jgi:hypothetical protein|nr:hypothetical protein [Enterococcaceae bacterium]